MAKRRQSIRALEREIESLRREVDALKASLESERVARESAEREQARLLGIPFSERERERTIERTSVDRRRIRRAPRSISVQSVAREFDDVSRAVEFARVNRIPPSEWADELADEFDVDVHAIYEDYYDTDPAQQAAA